MGARTARRDEDRDAHVLRFFLRENRPLSDFIDAKYTFLNERLAKFYNIFDVKGPDFRAWS